MRKINISYDIILKLSNLIFWTVFIFLASLSVCLFPRESPVFLQVNLLCYVQTIFILHAYRPINKGIYCRTPTLICCRLQCCGSGSGIRCFFYPWIRDPDPGSGMKKSKSRTRDPERTSKILFLRIMDQFFGLKILKFFDADPDPGSGILSTLDPGSRMKRIGSRIQDKHPGSATLVVLFGSTPLSRQLVQADTKRRKTPIKVRMVLW
jgi:hypothetical protein